MIPFRELFAIRPKKTRSIWLDFMSRYSEIRASSRKAHAKAYANGGRVKSAKTVINIINPPPRASEGAPSMPVPPTAGASGAPGVLPRPVPPMAGNAALQGMGAPPMLANGGRVPQAAGRVPKGKVPGKMPSKAGAASGEGRLKRARNPKSKG